MAPGKGDLDDWLTSDGEASVTDGSTDEPDWVPTDNDSDVWQRSDTMSVDAAEPCCMCGSTADAKHMLICDTCDLCFHTKCVGEKRLPKEASWRCPACAEADAAAAASALKSISKLAGARATATAAKVAAAGVQARGVLTSARPKRQAAQRAAAKAMDAAAEDDDDADGVPMKRPRGRPRLTDEERQHRQQAEAERLKANGCGACSITVVNKTKDIELPIYDALFAYIQTQPAGGVALERGGQYGHLHIQAIAKVYAVSARQVNLMLKGRLQHLLERSHSICVKKLTDHGLHTWHGMIGYIHKDSHLPHFRIKLHNITDADVALGREQYLKYGAGSLKNRAPLTPRNIFEKAMVYTELHGQTAPLGLLSFQQTLLEMLRTGKYYPVGWLNPGFGKGMNHERAAALWRILTAPATVQPEDVHRVLFWGGEATEYPPRGLSVRDTSEYRLRQALDTYFDQPPSPAADIQRDPPESRALLWGQAAEVRDNIRLWDDGGLGDALGPAGDYRADAAEADNMEYWQCIAAQMCSLLEQPSSSQQAEELGEALKALKAMMAERDAAAADPDLPDLPDMDDLVYTDRGGDDDNGSDDN